MSMSRTQLHNKVKALTGRSATAYLRFVRMSEAQKLLKDPNLNISDIAYQVGFNDPGYFTRSFVKVYGFAPSERR
jgi:AraC-like DNA-binding protein